MACASQPVADQRVARAYHEEENPGSDESKIEHGALLGERLNIGMRT
jgi:hypothetical protein